MFIVAGRFSKLLLYDYHQITNKILIKIAICLYLMITDSLLKLLIVFIIYDWLFSFLIIATFHGIASYQISSNIILPKSLQIDNGYSVEQSQNLAVLHTSISKYKIER